MPEELPEGYQHEKTVTPSEAEKNQIREGIPYQQESAPVPSKEQIEAKLGTPLQAPPPPPEEEEKKPAAKKAVAKKKATKSAKK